MRWVVLLVSLLLLGYRGQAQTGLSWQVQFFNTVFLTGEVLLNRTDNAPFLAYHWGSASPAPGVNPDNFSVRWGTDAYFPAGLYRFTAQADDAMRLDIDFQPVFDLIARPRPGQRFVFDVPLAEGMRHLQVDYQDYGGDAYLYLTWERIGSPPPRFNLNDSLWTVEYFNTPDLSGPPAVIRTEAAPGGVWGTAGPAAGVSGDVFSARWTSLQVLAGGSYQIVVRADDGVRVFVDDLSFINEFHPASGQPYSAIFNLSSGLHSIVVEYYNGGGEAFLDYAQAPYAFPAPGTATTALVTAFKPNIRSAPDAAFSTVIGQALKGDALSALARSPRDDWWLVMYREGAAWVAAESVMVETPHALPVVGSADAALPTQPLASCPNLPPTRLKVGESGRALPDVRNRLYAIPSASGARTGEVLAGETFNVLAGPLCLSNSAWWQVQYAERLGWLAENVAEAYHVEPT